MAHRFGAQLRAALARDTPAFTGEPGSPTVELRLTNRMKRILRELAQDPNGGHYGLDLARAAGLKTGTIHPELVRLERAGWVESTWEDETAERPRRRLYQITPLAMRCRAQWAEVDR